MMTKQWLFESNVFRLLAERSLQRFSKFCYIFMERLLSNTSDTFFSEKYQQLSPYFTAFNDAYDLKFGNKAERKGDTKLLYQQLSLLSSSKSHAWDVAIQSVFLNTTPEYTKILPQGTSPLSRLPIEQRIQYLGNAVTMMSNYPALHAVYLEMKTFHADLIHARGTQEQKEGNVNDAIGDVMLKAYALSTQLYGVLGAFMTKYCENPSQIKAYFPVFLLRQKRKNVEDTAGVSEIKVAAATTVEGGFSFNMYDIFNLYITGETNMELYFVPDKNAVKPSNTIKMSPQDIKTIAVKDYASQDDRFFMIQNLSATEEGEIEISLG